ncbi:MAG: D-galactarate dehydratase [Pseudomonadota bacterium]
MGRLRWSLVICVAVAGCADVPVLGRLAGGSGGSETGAPAPLPGATTAGPSRPVARPTAPPPAASASAAQLDTVSDAEKAAARQAASAAPAGGELGQVTVALGDPGDAGLWVKSALVSENTEGTVRTGSGDAIAVTLRPLGSGDGGPQISLAALRALGLPLTGLHPVTLARSG